MVDRDKLRTQGEAAEYAGCSKRQIRRWLTRGILHKPDKDRIYYDPDELDKCKCKRGSTQTGDPNNFNKERMRKGAGTLLNDFARIRLRLDEDLASIEQRLQELIEGGSVLK